MIRVVFVYLYVLPCCPRPSGLPLRIGRFTAKTKGSHTTCAFQNPGPFCNSPSTWVTQARKHAGGSWATSTACATCRPGNAAESAWPFRCNTFHSRLVNTRKMLYSIISISFICNISSKYKRRKYLKINHILKTKMAMNLKLLLFLQKLCHLWNVHNRFSVLHSSNTNWCHPTRHLPLFGRIYWHRWFSPPPPAYPYWFAGEQK